MPSFWPVYKRELKTYLQSPSTYIVLALLFLMVGFAFSMDMVEFVNASTRASQPGMFGQQPEAPNVTFQVIRNFFGLMSFMLLIMIPILSMRLVAEEKSSGTFELLVTCPISDWAILTGKYLALMTIGLIIIALSALFPAIVWWAGLSKGSAPEWPVVISCWVGLLLIFSTYAAFGVMASSFTESQISAAFITLIGLFLWFLIGYFPMETHPIVRKVITEFNAAQHTQNFMNGVLVLKDLAFYGLTSFLFLFIASKTLEARRWRV